jgi:hypothetical protein
MKNVGLTGLVYVCERLNQALHTLGRKWLILASVNPGPVKRGSTVTPEIGVAANVLMGN